MEDEVDDERNLNDILEEVIENDGEVTPPVETPPAGDGDETPPGEDSNPPASEEETPPAGDGEETPPEEETPPQEESPIKKLRQSNAQRKAELDAANALIERAASLAGMTVDEYKEKLQADEDKKAADKLGVSPEVAERIRKLEEKNTLLEQSQKRNAFIANANKLQTARELTDEQVETFVKDATNKGFDLTNPNLSFEDVYFALNHTTFEESIRADERQKVLADIEAQNNGSPSIVKNTGTGDGKTKKGFADLYADLEKQGIK